MNDEVEESLVDDLLERCVREERQHTSKHFERQARATLQLLVKEGRRLPHLNPGKFREAINLIRRLLAATADHPRTLVKALGYRETKKDAQYRAMMRAMECLHDEPLGAASTGGGPPSGRGHRFSLYTNKCMLCEAEGSGKKGWPTDCPKNPPRRIRSKGTCAMAVAEAAEKAGITNANGRRMDSAAVLRKYDRWGLKGAPQ